MMGHDPRLPRMPEKPTLFDFFKLRFGPPRTCSSPRGSPRRTGVSEKIVLACLLHDIAVSGFIRADHGYWGAQLLEPYVDEEVTWAIRHHQALRFFPDESSATATRSSTSSCSAPTTSPSRTSRRLTDAREHKWYSERPLASARQLRETF